MKVRIFKRFEDFIIYSFYQADKYFKEYPEFVFYGKKEGGLYKIYLVDFEIMEFILGTMLEPKEKIEDSHIIFHGHDAPIPSLEDAIISFDDGKNTPLGIFSRELWEMDKKKWYLFVYNPRIYLGRSCGEVCKAKHSMISAYVLEKFRDHMVLRRYKGKNAENILEDVVNRLKDIKGMRFRDVER